MHGGAGGGVVVVGTGVADVVVGGTGSAIGLGVVARGAEQAAVTSAAPTRVTTVLRIRCPLADGTCRGSVRVNGPEG
ncbi:hypothetical protein GCM10017567_06950 [Amycolatopsis bullii]|uniref:Uncharacterized protein n=1 Tax=Amycolatopsis bullii TaxID=941987 RepID=A0ABQ3K2R3_9PSEU|nr:hypothetical protein GCM10017567_06950 [Amycolatopsis bullii]